MEGLGGEYQRLLSLRLTLTDNGLVFCRQVGLLFWGFMQQ